VTLRDLLEGLELGAVQGSLDVPITGVAYDSRRVRSGDAFFALTGTRNDGAGYARAAVQAGAVAVIGATADAIDGATAVAVAEPRRALAHASARWFGDPSLALRVVAVTGTNGKTTTTFLLESVFRAAGWTPGVIGTTGVHLGDDVRPASLTTPEAPELQGLLAEMREHGVNAVALEMSSHALVQRRGYGLHADVAVFTNLSRDHLDYHGTLDAYLDAKLMLFDGRNQERRVKPWTAVVNADDAVAPRVLSAAGQGGGTVWTFGHNRAATFRITHVAPKPDGIELGLAHEGVETALTVPLLGRYNAWNAAAAFAAARAIGVGPGTIARGLATSPPVPGRLEPVFEGQPFLVAVDYAHTPDALERALAAVREHAPGRVLLVFGCGGDRDPGKRPLMGRAAAEGAELAWVTNDNPRSEDPAAIAQAITAGAPEGKLQIELDRRRAIARALAEARPGDAVLIAGKGHETTQTIGSQVLPFDDRVVAAEQLRAGRTA
jgi:UDP-N-acetylmuramoyl-L-alanyl-D-glutamate--2,6-diaminopimelate ligase